MDDIERGLMEGNLQYAAHVHLDRCVVLVATCLIDSADRMPNKFVEGCKNATKYN